jgi:hypothetical protein
LHDPAGLRVDENGNTADRGAARFPDTLVRRSVTIAHKHSSYLRTLEARPRLLLLRAGETTHDSARGTAKDRTHWPPNDSPTDGARRRSSSRTLLD